MSKYTHQSFKNFLIGLVEKKTLSLELLSDIVGLKTATHLLNNAANETATPHLDAVIIGAATDTQSVSLKLSQNHYQRV
ncbi:MAG: spore coat protein [Legionella sp.]|nr:spore coat protein [Legionella sp.]